MELREAVKKQSEENFSLLLHYYKRGIIVPFIGSGFSANISGNKFPQWRKFLLEYAERIGLKETISDKANYATEYNKSKIISLLLVHDLPEIYTGDIPVSTQTPDKQENETAAMQKIAALDLFPFFHSFRSMEQLWHEFDAKADINAALAYQIDKLEPLVQLYIYRSALPDEQRSYQLKSWIQKANEQLSMCKVPTSFGSKVLECLSTYLLGNDFFIY